MFRPLLIFLLFLVSLLAAVLPEHAYSQLRAVPQQEDVALPQANGMQSGPSTPEVGADADRFYDGANPDLHKLQRGAEVRDGLPRDKRAAVDWMNALRSGAITPRASLDGKGRVEVLNLDIILKNTKEMPYVKFPHNSHTEWLACGNCHDKLFVPKAGANPITMEKIFRGEYCGACHDRVAFITHYACERCHSVPQGNGKKWW